VAESAKKRAQVKLLGANVRRVRNSRGLTQERLAEMTDLHLRSIQKVEGGEMTILVTTLYRLRGALKCSWGELLGH
jgi:transcriptional regulator with XRE-family HTH domain